MADLTNERKEYLKSLSSDERKTLFLDKATQSQKITLDRKLYNQVLDKLSPDLTIHFRNTLNFHKSDLTISSRDNFLSWKFDHSFEDFMITIGKTSSTLKTITEPFIGIYAAKELADDIIGGN